MRDVAPLSLTEKAGVPISVVSRCPRGIDTRARQDGDIQSLVMEPTRFA
ncbi:MAG: hypothetical protein JWR81_2725 [Pseudonocardia sp.]|jgi:hypothetical protein|nr:hypothetical protein [Pseudonocardia sp.]MDT7613937.1 hypothetical protein [Pseudonocardiales bacterium]